MDDIKKLLIIDDDVDICSILSRIFINNGFLVDVAYSSKSGLAKFKTGIHQVVLCDFRLPDSDGLKLIKLIKAINHTTQVVIVTGYSDVKLAIQCIREGAFEYVTKPIQREEILSVIQDAYEKTTNLNRTGPSEITIKSSKRDHSNTGSLPFSNDYFFGDSSASSQLLANISIIAPTNMNVLILGETGTGKEVVAKLIHSSSKRSKEPFVAIDCGALPHELASSELFGHVKGAFTGALNDKIGSFELANGGTLFLDEIGNLSYENQIKLLRVIQERTIKRVGGTSEISVDVRIIAATNEKLVESIKKEGQFRGDLYYRLNEFSIELLPLKDRQNDLIEFAEFFMSKANVSLNKEVKSISSEVRDKLIKYNWPGNLRELRNVIKRAVLLTKGDSIQLSALPQEISQFSLLFENSGEELENTDEITSLKSVTENAEKSAIIQALKTTNFNKTKTARLLNVDRKTLYNKLVLYNIET
jgi:two-component system, NtrC family, response regulator HydG